MEEHGYRSLEAVVREDDERLAARTGLGLKRARALKQAAQAFLAKDWKDIAEKRAANRLLTAKLIATPIPPSTWVPTRTPSTWRWRSG